MYIRESIYANKAPNFYENQSIIQTISHCATHSARVASHYDMSSW